MPRKINPASKTRSKDNPYEIWESLDHSWRWYVLKKYQTPTQEAKNHYARWFCFVTSPYVPDGEYGDTYISDIISYARKVEENGKPI